MNDTDTITLTSAEYEDLIDTRDQEKRRDSADLRADHTERINLLNHKYFQSESSACHAGLQSWHDPIRLS